MKKTVLSKTPAKLKQLNALARARHWRGNFPLVKRAIKEAAEAFPISEIQWYNLQQKFGYEAVRDLKAVVQP